MSAAFTRALGAIVQFVNVTYWLAVLLALIMLVLLGETNAAVFFWPF